MEANGEGPDLKKDSDRIAAWAAEKVRKDSARGRTEGMSSGNNENGQGSGRSRSYGNAKKVVGRDSLQSLKAGDRFAREEGDGRIARRDRHASDEDEEEDVKDIKPSRKFRAHSPSSLDRSREGDSSGSDDETEHKNVEEGQRGKALRDNGRAGNLPWTDKDLERVERKHLRSTTDEDTRKESLKSGSTHDSGGARSSRDLDSGLNRISRHDGGDVKYAQRAASGAGMDSAAEGRGRDVVERGRAAEDGGRGFKRKDWELKEDRDCDRETRRDKKDRDWDRGSRRDWEREEKERDRKVDRLGGGARDRDRGRDRNGGADHHRDRHRDREDDRVRDRGAGRERSRYKARSRSWSRSRSRERKRSRSRERPRQHSPDRGRGRENSLERSLEREKEDVKNGKSDALAKTMKDVPEEDEPDAEEYLVKPLTGKAPAAGAGAAAVGSDKALAPPVKAGRSSKWGPEANVMPAPAMAPLPISQAGILGPAGGAGGVPGVGQSVLGAAAAPQQYDMAALAAQVAAAKKAVELVNKNLGFSMSSDEKKKLLWGSKKAAAVEQPTTDVTVGANRWDTVHFADRDREEKFQKLMGLKSTTGKPSGEAGEGHNAHAAGDSAHHAPGGDSAHLGGQLFTEERQKELQEDLERQFAAGLRRRDGRTVGLGL